MRLDLHTHTKFSRDSLSDPIKLITHAKRIGLGAIAITDHNNIKAYNTLDPKLKTDTVICGEEINTDKGEVIALFLNEEINPRSLMDVMDKAQEQQAFVFVPHPFDRLRKKRLDPTQLDNKTLAKINGIETFNSRIVYWKEDTEKAISFAKENEKPMLGGSDAHLIPEVGKCYTEIPNCDGVEEIRKHLFRGNTNAGGSAGSPIWHVGTKIVKMIKKR
ncbi:PHP domain-containing protein [Candidatus Micrarchaeota archaeon]|nr:PHP domain-containing protein [Candidatus Micrarchaeota archaeon]MBU1165853.1 PHP domain-containing protein [Candidatus Micrarchaeota archaeon]MBU1887015.1 PHP domain-containing protein [Candidatus Micrarchaeota archaeon]